MTTGETLAPFSAGASSASIVTRERIGAALRTTTDCHFLANFGRGKSPEATRRNYALFGERVIPLLRAAGV